MATETIIRHVDDVEHAAGREVTAEHPDFTFGLDGRHYEIDLSEANRTRLQEILAPYTLAARRTTSRAARTITRAPAAPRRATVDREQNQAIREWATRRGMKVAEKGRIPAAVLEAYGSALLHDDKKR